MTDRKTQEQQLGARLGRFILRHPWLVMAASLLIVVAAGSGARHLGFDQDYRAFFSDENPELVAFEQMQRTYTKSDTILITLLPQGGLDVVAPEVLQAVETLTEQAWQLPFALRVDSLTNFQHTAAEEDDLVVGDLVVGAAELTEASLATVRSVALSEPNLVHQLVAEDLGATGVLVTFQMPGESVEEMPQAAEATRLLAESVEADFPVDIHLTGLVMLNNAFFQSSMADMAGLVPLMYLMIFLVVFVLVRSLMATIGTVIVLMFSVIAGMGVAGWMGVLLTPPSAIAPTIITTLAVADAIHILITMLSEMRRGRGKAAAIVESLRVNLQPVFLTTVTTAIGFLSLNASDAPPFHDLGNITAVGVSAAFVFSIFTLPAFLTIVPVSVKVVADRGNDRFDRLAAFVTRRRNVVLMTSMAVAVALVAMVPLNTINDDYVSYFDESTTFRQATELTLEHLTGIYQLQFSLPAGDSNGVSDPRFLQRMDSFVGWLREQPEVLHVQSITDTFKRLNKNLHGDDDAWYRLPEERDQAAQYLLLYELSLPYGLDLNNQLNIDKSATRLTATLTDMPSGDLLTFVQRSEDWLAEHAEIHALGVGPTIMFAYISERNIASMINGTVAALLLITLIMLVALRSVKLGIISLIPNLLPAAAAFGLWGLFVGEVNLAVSMVMGMTLGIVVDDSVHFLSKYLRGRRERDLTSQQAVAYAFNHVGQAILVTSLILIAGFAILAQSTFALNSYMAQLTTLTIAMALLADFFLLPTLLMALDRGAPSTV